MLEADYDGCLAAAAGAALEWLDGLDRRPVGPAVDAAGMLAAVAGPLPERGDGAVVVVRELAALAPPGLMATGSGRFHGWVIGGALPVAIAADWLVSAWDQNSAMAEPFPATTMIEQVAGDWVLELLDLPRSASVGFVTGGQAANTVCLAAARNGVLAAHGWDVERDGLQGAPRVHVVAGAERHDTIDVALRALGLGGRTARVAAADGAGRMEPRALEAILARLEGPVIVCAQAGNVNGGGVDPLDELADAVDARGRADTWLHVDGAFGLWGRAAPRRRALLAGAERAHSWATDAHKWLNTPYDCGMAICADAGAHRRAMGVRAAYLPEGGDAALRDPVDVTPELSRRARGVPVWAAIRHLGREGVAELVERCCAMADRYAARLGAAPGAEVLGRCLNQVVVRFRDPAGRDDDAHTRRVLAQVQRGGECFPSGTVWRGAAGIRISVCNWRTDAADVDRGVAAMLAAHRAGAAVSPG
ncbi:pyridoxal phosphate-dependent decarboxylase family protein [Miltoncostaea marina]|uniref:pyridoxal phosphate-dependent decarboxylase family protein n=1 Tax=Miltoncostaea marina TaxID=2843215 RepID=UPI001C3D8B57|nr:pyridoxal-dependent decarboxylase [Miltoncostaea marina]